MPAPKYMSRAAHTALTLSPTAAPVIRRGAPHYAPRRASAPSSLCTLWLLPCGRVRSHNGSRTQAPQRGAIRLAASLHPQEMREVWRLFVAGTDGERHCIEAVLVRIRAEQAPSARTRLTRKHREDMARTYRALIREVRAQQYKPVQHVLRAA